MIARRAIFPQAAPVMLAQLLYTFESNTLSATMDQAAFIILLILAAVGVIDVISRRIRLRLIRA